MDVSQHWRLLLNLISYYYSYYQLIRREAETRPLVRLNSFTTRPTRGFT